MQQIKLFKSIESDIAQLEREVNDWLTDSGVSVINIFGNIAPQTVADPQKAITSGRGFSPSDVFITVLYEAG